MFEKQNEIDIDIKKLSLEQCIKLRGQLTRHIERTPAQIYLEENFFFMKEKNKQKVEYQERVIDRVASFLNELYKVQMYDLEDFDYIYAKLSTNLHSRYGLKKSLVYFYNEAIPIAYKNNIFSYKRMHPKTEEYNDNVKNHILMVAKEYRNHRMGLIDPPKGK